MVLVKLITFLLVFGSISADEWNIEVFGRNVFDKDLHERVLNPELCMQQLGFITSNVVLALQFEISAEEWIIEEFGSNVFDLDLHERVLNPELCIQQIGFIKTNHLLEMLFHDAGARIPRGMLTGNLQDWGQYHQCLAIRNHMDEGQVLQGKYCSLQVPVMQGAAIPSWIQEESKVINVDDDVMELKSNFDAVKQRMQVLADGRAGTDISFEDQNFIFGICIPKTCTTSDVMNFLTFDGALLNVTYTEQFCRLPDDKPFSAADIVAVSIFSVIALLLLLSTLYDLNHNFIQKRDRKQASTLLCSFSLFTNTRRLLSFNYAPDALHCLDGIRALAMLWVVVGHVWSTYAMTVSNPIDVFAWMLSVESFWILAAPITVDTFFMMTGLLLIYTTVGKLSQRSFLKRIHLFYILRYLRLFPLLAIIILIQASLIHHMSDGPRWHTFALSVENCRNFWWAPLVFLQNYVNLEHQCLPVTWYLCVEMQLFWVSPLVLIWVLGGRRGAWISLIAALLASLIIVTVYCFVFDFPLSFLHIDSPEAAYNFFRHYYVNTLARASPFCVGMIMGYVLHLWRGRKIQIPKFAVCILWLLTMGLLAGIVFVTYPTTQLTHDNQILDNFMNAYMRGVWAACLGWIIIASVHGYGGPVNWFLSLNMWKLPARLSYAMYLIHFPLMHLVQGTFLSPVHYATSNFVYRFFADLLFSFFVAFLLTLAVDSPFSTLQKLLLGGGDKKVTSPPVAINKPTDYEKAPDAPPETSDMKEKL